MEKILFVCTANICRSPMAQAIFNALAEDMGLSSRATSAGVSALVGESMAPNARAAMEEIGVPPGAHRARQIDKAMLEEADLVLAMSPQHVAKLLGLYGDFAYKVHALPEYAHDVPGGGREITDPYGHTMAAYRACGRQLFDCLSQLVTSLKDGKGV